MASSDQQFIAHVATTSQHPFRWPTLSSRARHYVEFLELTFHLKRLLATGARLDLPVVPHPRQRSRPDGTTTEFDTYRSAASRAAEPRHVHIQRPSRAAGVALKTVPRTALPTTRAQAGLTESPGPS
jgi:hypothetical protein